MKYWLLKSEPSKYSWQDLCKDEKTLWDGVKNYQAINNMKQMSIGDLAFFYHSNQGKEIVGVIEISKEFYVHEKMEGVVEVRYHSKIEKPVTLKEIKSNAHLKNIALVKQPRLSVMIIPAIEWNTIIQLSNNVS